VGPVGNAAGVLPVQVLDAGGDAQIAQPPRLAVEQHVPAIEDRAAQAGVCGFQIDQVDVAPGRAREASGEGEPLARRGLARDRIGVQHREIQIAVRTRAAPGHRSEHDRSGEPRIVPQHAGDGLESGLRAHALDHALTVASELAETGLLARLELAASAVTGAAPLAEEAVDPDRVYTLNGQITEPRLVRRIDPEYPRLDRVRGDGGTVVLLVVVDRTGEVGVERVLRSVNPRLDAAATRAVRRWRYAPASLAETPVAVYKVVTLRFVP